MTKLKKINYIHLFLFLLPILDFLTLLIPNISFIGISFKAILLFYAIFYLIKNTKHKKIFLFLGIYFFVYLYYIFSNHLDPVLEIANTITLFSLPFLILFFANYQNEKITKKTITILFLIYFIFYTFTYFLGFGVGYQLSNLFILLFSISFIYLLESNSYLLKGLSFILLLVVSMIIHAKTFYLSIVMILFYFLITNFKKAIIFIKKNYLKSLITLLAILLCIAVSIPKMNLLTTLKEHKVNSIQEIFTYQNIDKVLSGRLQNLNNVQNQYKNSDSLEKVLGLGIEKLNIISYIEIDLLDIFYSIGIVGILFYILFFIYVLRNSNLKKNYIFIILLLLFLSCFGNVLTNYYLIPFLGLLFLISKNDNGIMKKDILFVSNMYPSDEFPYYGIFVKNTYEVLAENHSIDLAVMYKTVGKINKFVAYVRMCGLSLLKAVFENYDYIYVHFASHTPAGVFIPYLCSKNTKFVINVHGNDVVPDTKTDKNYMLLSKLFLHFADIVIAPSKYFKKELIKNYNIPKDKIVVYPSGGVNLEQFKKINKKTAMKNAGLDNKYKYFGYIARISKNKGYDIYIKAINVLQKNKKYKDVRYILVGSGNEEDKLNELIQKYKLEKVIIRMPLVSQEKLVNIYNSLEAFVYPTRMQSESLGLTGLEAMACETLVIGGDKFGPSDYLKDKENSFTFKPNDYKELAEKMSSVLEMKVTQKNKITKNARKKSEEYSFLNTKDILLKVFAKR